MQFSTITILFTSFAAFAYASRASTIKAGLAVVGNHQHDSYHQSSKASNRAFDRGDVVGGYLHANDAGKARDTNKRIGGAVAGVKKPRSLEFLGNDETHEYFARAIVEDEQDYYYY